MIAGKLRVRRKYRTGHRCQDCGWNKPTTVIVWWASGGTYRVCGECIRPYRGSILGPAHGHTIRANA